MPYEYKWLKEPDYYQVTLTGIVTQTEIDEWMNRVLVDLDRNPNMTSTIVDMRSHPKFEFSILKMQSVTKVAKHPRAGWVVVVGTSPLISFWLEALRKVAGLKFKVFPTIEDAESFLTGILRVEEERNANNSR